MPFQVTIRCNNRHLILYTVPDLIETDCLLLPEAVTREAGIVPSQKAQNGTNRPLNLRKKRQDVGWDSTGLAAGKAMIESVGWIQSDFGCSKAGQRRELLLFIWWNEVGVYISYTQIVIWSS